MLYYTNECVSHTYSCSDPVLNSIPRWRAQVTPRPTFAGHLGASAQARESVRFPVWPPDRTMHSWIPGACVEQLPVAEPVQRGVSLWVHTHTPWDNRDDKSHRTWNDPCAWVVFACHTYLYIIVIVLVIYIRHSHCTYWSWINYIYIIYCTMHLYFVYIYLNASSFELPLFELNKV